MSNRNARLTVHGRLLLVERVRAGRPVAHVAAEMGVSRPTAYKSVSRWRAEGQAGLEDRPSRPRATSHRTPAVVEARACELRTARKLGPAPIGPILGLALDGAPHLDPPPPEPAGPPGPAHRPDHPPLREQPCGSIQLAALHSGFTRANTVKRTDRVALRGRVVTRPKARRSADDLRRVDVARTCGSGNGRAT